MADLSTSARLSVAPMMAWTDRHCRMFHRTLSKQTLLYTEMVTAPALVLGGALRLLDHDPAEHPLAVQLGGSDPDQLKQATKLCVDAGYTEVNLNVGCPSDRVQSGAFGAVLMKNPDLVADCVKAMQDVTHAEVTVKCRIGVDDQTPAQVLPNFVDKMQNAGIRRMTIHARMAWLKGLSPKDNRTIPPLDYGLVHQMKTDFPQMHISLNGGVETLVATKDHLTKGIDGVMIGRAAYHTPAEVLLQADEQIYGAAPLGQTALGAGHAMTDYIDGHIAQGGRLHQITRHMMGLFAGQPGARNWRRRLSELGADNAATVADFVTALNDVENAVAHAADLERIAQ